MAIVFKDGVDPTGVKPEILVGLMVADGVYTDYNVATVVTSITDGQHGRSSLHAFGFAVDLRTKHLPADVDKGILASQIQRRLGSKYDVIFEPQPQHIHMEFDPR